MAGLAPAVTSILCLAGCEAGCMHGTCPRRTGGMAQGALAAADMDVGSQARRIQTCEGAEPQGEGHAGQMGPLPGVLIIL